MRPKKKKALIIGSGVSGLAAAQTLFDHGFDVQILEARADHGGRVRKNDTFAGFPIDIGGEEIHQVHSLYHHLALKHGAEFQPDDELFNYFEDVNEEKLLDREAFFKKYEDQHYYDDIIDNLETLDDSQSLEDYFKQKGLPQPFFNVFENFWGVENGGSLNEISVKSFGEYNNNWLSDHDLNLVISNMSQFDILERIFASVLHLIRYKTPITKIDYSSANKIVSVLDAQNNQFEADYLIVTVPISQLQNNSITFTPSLPERKLDAISRMKFGKGGKIHLKFKSLAFWPQQTRNIFLQSKISFLWNVYHRKAGTENPRTNIIVGLVAGNIMQEMQIPEQRQLLVDELLEKMARVFNYPSIKEDLEEVMWSDFTEIEYINGVYTMPSLNLGNSRAIYQEPVDDILFFAGEASHLTHAMTIHGAYETGLREAQRIIALSEGNQIHSQ